MRSWYQPSDLLPGRIERIIPATSTLTATVTRILTETRLAGTDAPPLPPTAAHTPITAQTARHAGHHMLR